MSRAVCAYAHDFWKRPGCAFIAACALNKTNMVLTFLIGKNYTVNEPRHEKSGVLPLQKQRRRSAVQYLSRFSLHG